MSISSKSELALHEEMNEQEREQFETYLEEQYRLQKLYEKQKLEDDIVEAKSLLEANGYEVVKK